MTMTEQGLSTEACTYHYVRDLRMVWGSVDIFAHLRDRDSSLR